MQEFFTTYKGHIFWALGVIVLVMVLRTLTNRFYNRLAEKDLISSREERIIPSALLKHILNTVWWVLGIVALSFIFVDAGEYKVVLNRFYVVLYLGGLVIFTIVGATATQMWFKVSIKKKEELGEDATALKFYRYVVVVIIYFVGFLFALLAFPSLKNVAQAALGGAGVLALIIGLAAQEALSNVIGGVFIISFKPFRLGDRIKITDTMVGTVSDITLRHTIIRNAENKMIVIPNSVINKEKLINFDLGERKCCEHIQIGIAYESDVVLAKKIMREVCEAHPLLLDNRTKAEKKNGNPIVKTALISLDESSVAVRAWAWAKNYGDAFQLKCDVLEEIKSRFDKEGIDIPFPNRTIHIRNLADLKQ